MQPLHLPALFADKTGSRPTPMRSWDSCTQMSIIAHGPICRAVWNRTSHPGNVTSRCSTMTRPLFPHLSTPAEGVMCTTGNIVLDNLFARRRGIEPRPSLAFGYLLRYLIYKHSRVPINYRRHTDTYPDGSGGLCLEAHSRNALYRLALPSRVTRLCTSA